MGYMDFADIMELSIRGSIKQIEEDERNAVDRGYGYWLDNCGDDIWYCDHCFQKYECGKRLKRA